MALGLAHLLPNSLSEKLRWCGFQPAAAWYFTFSCCRCFALRAKHRQQNGWDLPLCRRL